MRLFTGLSKAKKSIFQSGAAGSSTESAVSGQIRKDWTFFSSQVLVPHSNCRHPKREHGWGDERYHEVNGKKKLNVYRHGTLVRAKTTSPPSKNLICLNLCPLKEHRGLADLCRNQLMRWKSPSRRFRLHHTGFLSRWSRSASSACRQS